MSWRPSRLAACASLLAFVCVLGFDSAPSFAEQPRIAGLKWIHPDADAVEVLSQVRPECSVTPRDAERARRLRLGRIAFRSPRLLGGVAARVGMSCDSCHRNGHDNPTFHFSGVSGEAGTADVTGSVFSTMREDGIPNPVVIPTLVDVAAAPPFGTIEPATDLRKFLHAVVVDEFQGEPPPESVAESLLAYVESLRSIACPKGRIEAVTFETDKRELLATLRVAVESVERGDLDGALFVLASLRAVLERVYRRFPEQVSAREGLVDSSRALSRLREKLEVQSAPERLSSLAAERRRLEVVLRRLEAKVGDSFYDSNVLRRALAERPLIRSEGAASMPQLRVRDIEVYHEIHGSGPRLLFIGGSGGDLRQKPGVFDGPLVGQFEVLSYDQRGLGQTSVPAGPYTMPDYAEDAKALLDAVGWRDCLVVGVSFGGMVAQELVCRYPNRVKRLVLACTSSGGLGGASYPLHELQDLPEEDRILRMIEISDLRHDESWREAHPKAVASLVEFSKKRAAAGTDEPDREIGQRLQFEARSGHDTFDRLARFDLPVYLCAGRFDGIAPPENQHALERNIPGARLDFFEGGHLFLIQDKTAFEKIAAFLLEEGK